MSDDYIISIPQDVRDKVKAIEAERNDSHSDDGWPSCGGPHIMADQLHVAVLKAIAMGAKDAVALATEALKTEDMEFPRWYE